MKIIVAGSNTRNAEEKCIENGLCKLYSILHEKKQIEAWNDDHFLMVDSFDFIKSNKDKKVVWVEFDVYDDLPMSVMDDFYDRVMALGIAGKFIRVYHHYLDKEPGNYDTLHKWINQGQTYIGMGPDNMDNFDDIFAITRDKIKLHGFALTRIPVIEKYPFWSVDSTSPLSTVIFGRYSRPILSFNERDDIYKAKSIQCFDDDWVRLERAIIETKKAEDYITSLWAIKGIVWEDLKY